MSHVREVQSWGIPQATLAQEVKTEVNVDALEDDGLVGEYGVEKVEPEAEAVTELLSDHPQSSESDSLPANE